MRHLNYQLKQLCHTHVDGGFATRQNRHRILQLAADQLHGLGYRKMSAESLKPKHIEALLKHWQGQVLATGTVKNRMSALRWWAAKVGKRSVVAKHNDHYGIERRVYVSNTSKATSLPHEALAKIPDAHVRMSLALQAAFGLRREEALKFQPSYADRGDHLALKPSWTKGGRARTIPIRTDEQRAILQRAHRVAGLGSLIPNTRNYVQQLRIYERHTARAGLSKLHGLRHHYAQMRYQALTGWPAPAAGGPTLKDLTPDQKASDRLARLIISRELGHEREQITAVYLGR